MDECPKCNIDKYGFDKYGNHENGTSYDNNGFDVNGKHQYNKTLYNKSRDRDGNDERGFNEKHIHKDTGTKFDENELDYRFFNRDRNNSRTGTKYDQKSLDYRCFDRFGHFFLDGVIYRTTLFYDECGFNVDGNDERGFNEKHIHKDTGTKFGPDRFDKDGYDERGFNEKHIHKKTGTLYDERGFSLYYVHEITKTEFDENGFDVFYCHKNGTAFDAKNLNFFGRDPGGYDLKGKNELGYDKSGYNKDGFDKNGKHKNGSLKDASGNPSNLIDHILQRYDFEILYEDKKCIFAYYKLKEKTIFCAKQNSSKKQMIQISNIESLLVRIIKNFNRIEDNSNYTNDIDYSNLKDGSLIDFGWSAKDSEIIRQNALQKKIAIDGIKKTKKALTFLVNQYRENTHIHEETNNAVEMDLNWVKRFPSDMENKTIQFLDEIITKMFEKKPELERDYPYPDFRFIFSG